MTTVPTFRSDRRGFLKRGAAIGLAGAAPLLLANCGGGSGDGDVDAGADIGEGSRIQAREARHLHFDLSAMPVAAPKLFALRSAHHGAPLVEHDAASRARHRALNPALAGVDDARLTHYVEDADMPGGSLQSVLVMGTDPRTGAPALAGARIHVPQSALTSVARRAAASGRVRPLSAKARAYGIRPAATLADDAGGNDGSNDFATPFDVATFLVFHHPEVMNLKPDLGAEILNRIENAPCNPDDAECNPYAGTLADLVSSKGLATTEPGGWATLLPLTDLDGKPGLDADGQPLYRYDVDDEVAAATGAVVRQLLQGIYDDPLFEGTNWHATSGIASQSAGTATAAAGTAASRRSAAAAPAPRRTPLATALDEAFEVEADHPVGSWLSGVRIVGLEVTDASNRSVRMTVKNVYLRFLSVYVQYLDANEQPIAVAEPGELDSTRAKYVRMVSTNDQIMGIPFFGDQVESTDIEFSMPPGASHANVMFGSLGLGGEAFTPEAVAGACLTLGLNIGIPTILLAAGAYGDLKEGWDGILKDEAVLKTLLRSFKEGLTNAGADFAEGIYSSGDSKSCVPFITGLANVALQVLLSAAPSLLLRLSFYIGSSALQSALPVVGLVIKAISIAAELSAILVSVGEVLASKAIETNQVSLTMDTKIRIKHDPRDSRFPLSATDYTVEATYDGGAVPVVATGTIEPGRSEPIEVELLGRPSGGKVVVKVLLHAKNSTDPTKEGCLVGVKTTDPIVNLPETAGLIDVEIRELLAPLQRKTKYRHASKLSYVDGSRRWDATAAAPKATHDNLCAGADGAICQLNGITVHTATGMVGYGFFAGGQNVSQCGNNAGGTLHTIQNEFVGEDPDSGYKFSSCGFTEPVGIVYDPLGPAVGGHHFFLQPANDGFHLRGTTLDKTVPSFDLGQTKSWGRFSTALDSLTVLPSGYVVGVNRLNHKMEVLLLPAEPVDGAFEPTAVPFAAMKAGKGTRAGLLDTPVAVATWGGAVLVLEQGNRRVQALDPNGNPVPLFRNKTSPIMELVVNGTPTFLDLAVEGLGYMYVLAYVESGSLPGLYQVDIYNPDGDLLTTTQGIAAARIAVDLFRNLYTLNYEPVVGAPKVEPSLSQWLPSTDGACPSDLPGLASVRGSSAACGLPTLAAA